MVDFELGLLSLSSGDVLKYKPTNLRIKCLNINAAKDLEKVFINWL